MPRHQPRLFDLDPTDPLPWEAAAERDRLVAEVVFNRPIDTTFTYLVPEALREMIQVGQRIRAPFGRGNRPLTGFCVGLEPYGARNVKLKELDSVLDLDPIVSPRMLELTRWIAEYQLCSWGQVLETVVPAGVKKKAGTRLRTVAELAPGALALAATLRLPAKQKAVFEIVSQSDRAWLIEELAEAAECGLGPIHGLRDKRLLSLHRARTEQFHPDAFESELIDDLELNGDQRQALDQILDDLRQQRHRTILLHGVTGSGKTEVYIQAIREVVSYGRQAIVLVPEISLTPQTIRRFRSRFQSVAVLHSHLTDSERHWHWQRILRGEVEVIVGARSAVFAPAPHLGLIIIDEEHETSFKQDTTPRYHAREVARKRAEMQQIPLILGSATPTLESWQRVQAGHDLLISMPRRVSNLPLPPVVVVDVRNDPQIAKGAAIGRALYSGIQRALADDGQVILFLNLRGFSPTLWCHGCGETVRCPHCDITLTWHKDRNQVLCHFCDYEADPPRQCPSCQSPAVRYFGIGTQRLEQEVRARFPGVKCLRMDGDTMKRPGSHDEALEAFRRGEVRILLGTQMIAKGLDFPNVTLVGVVNADTMLHQPDLRASERTFQLLAQVAGRTGRSERGGRVLVQSSSPDDPAIQLVTTHDYLGFARRELAHRREAMAPPFVQWVRIVFRGETEPRVRDYALELAEFLRSAVSAQQAPIRILGPAPAPVARLKNHHRFHLQLSTTQPGSIHELWRSVEKSLPRTSDVEFVIDVDPINLR